MKTIAQKSFDDWTAHLVTRWLLDVRSRHTEADDETSMQIIDEIREREKTRPT